MSKNTNKNLLSTLAKTLTLITLLFTSSLTFANNCADNLWVDGQWYNAGDTVEFDGNIYVAVYNNPGYNPVISTWFWDWESTSDSCSYAQRENPGCNDNSWVDGRWYSAGSKVEYNGEVYIAVFGNPGYNPTISTWFWDWYSTNDASCNNTAPSDTNSGGDCGTQWYTANITTFSSYPDPNEFECPTWDNCPWMGLFKGLPNKMSESWVKNNNIIAVHSKHYEWLKGKTLKIKQGSKEIDATVYDECNDRDCNGCCTANMGNKNTLIDLERYTMKRFGSYYGEVKWQICN